MNKLVLAVQRVGGRIEKFLANSKKSASKYDSLGAVQVRQDKLQAEWAAYEEAWKAWQDAEDDAAEKGAAPAFDEGVRDGIEELVEEAQLYLVKLKERFVVAPVAAAGALAPAAATTSNIRLPPIKPPSFSGEFEEWGTFRDVFKALVNDNASLSDVHRLHLLREACVGKAADEIAGIELADGNFATAWETLVKKFENKRLVVFRLIEKLLNIPAMQCECSEQLSRLLNGTTHCVRALRVLQRPTNELDDLLVVLTVTKLDIVTRTSWEEAQGASKEMPTFTELDTFLCGVLGKLEALRGVKGAAYSPQTQGVRGSYQGRRTAQTHVVAVSNDGGTCAMCQGAHRLFDCAQFKALSVAERRGFVAEQRICFRCISSSRHLAQACTSRYGCRVCNLNHHALLHIAETVGSTAAGPAVGVNFGASSSTGAVAATSTSTAASGVRATPFDGPSRASTHICTSAATSDHRETLLPTAWVVVTTADGRTAKLRALMDQGSQVSLISRQAVQKLGLRWRAADVNLTGVAEAAAGKLYGCVQFTAAACNVKSRAVNICALVLATITADLPSVNIVKSAHTQLAGLQLADDTYWQSGKIDMLLGAATVAEVLQQGVRRADGLVAQETEFGWMLSGTTAGRRVMSHAVTGTTLQLDGLLQRFWEQEEITQKPLLSLDDERCEEIFNATTTRNAEGRYVVELPFRQGGRELGESCSGAVRRLKQMERKGERYEQMFEGYREFMRKYLELGHMELVPADELEAQPQCYLPHHAVFKPDSTTTKLRVVFDATAATSNGRGLNALLLTGPRLQETLAAILMRWRGHRVCFTADIGKMYRQILVTPSHQDYQRIVWREQPADPIQHFRLKTVTYGTASAPYMAVKTIQRLAEDERERFGKASQVVLNDFYVDDCMSGAGTLEDAVETKNQLLGMMQAGGFSLLKWSSNSTEFLKTLPDDYVECRAPLVIDEDDSVKALGVHWFPVSDEFRYKVSTIEWGAARTKRQMLAEIARLFDPLGLLAPVIITAKITMQSLWLTGLGWDEDLPEEVIERWHTFRHQLPALEEIRVKRWYGAEKNGRETMQLHGFSDASTAAYAACVYMRVTHADKSVTVTLLAAKTKVAPIKQQTVPRLELCGAVMLCRLMSKCRLALRLIGVEEYAWTDSTVVLAWLRKHANVWQTFVANRVSEIQQAMSTTRWHHVPGVENPADVASRGILPAELRHHPLWWAGPQWLHRGPEEWPKQHDVAAEEALVEERKSAVVSIVAERRMWELAYRVASWKKLLRLSAYCRKFLRAHRHGGRQLTAGEVEEARLCWLRLAQEHEYGDVQKLLGDDQRMRQLRLLTMTPFVDAHGLLRVGGRLTNAQLPYDERHPVILPGHNHITELIIQDAHERTFHGGAQATSGQLRQQYYVVSERRSVRKCVHRCVRCVRARPKLQRQLMGNLPAARVRPSRAFLHTAVDYAGPIRTRTTRGRGHHAHKSWIAVFVCLTSKAIHLELVSELSTAAYMAAFRRFTARRGACSDIYSDNGTNFVGADRELRRQLAECLRDDGWRTELAEAGTNFHFSPPGSPHFNGLAEAAVRMAKAAIQKVIGETTLTFEEMTTFLNQVEAALNSRPLAALTNDAGEAAILTPGHFLIGHPLTAIPEPSVLDTTAPTASRWRLVQYMLQHFWQRWQREYLHDLQQRRKWQKTNENIAVGDIVVLQDETLHCTRWRMGRITDTHPGADGLVRVVSVRTAAGVVKRAIAKVCWLPIDRSDVATRD